MSPQNHSSELGNNDKWDHVLLLINESRRKEAIDALIDLWSGGDFAAAHTIGAILESSENGEKGNLLAAEIWYSRAFAARPDDETQFSLAKVIMRIESTNNSANKERVEYATKLLEDLCSKNNPEAAIYLSMHLLNGSLIHKNIEKAEKLCKMAAEKKYVCALALLRGVKFRNREYFAAIKLHIKFVTLLISIIIKNRHDERLFGVVPLS